MAWIAVVPPSPRHPYERYQVRYQVGKRQRSAGIFPTKQSMTFSETTTLPSWSIHRVMREVIRLQGTSMAVALEVLGGRRSCARAGRRPDVPQGGRCRAEGKRPHRSGMS
jgi:hypothetical protein